MLRLHFLNVGAGDCTIIEHPSGHISMIDINNAESLSEDRKSALYDYYSSIRSLQTYNDLEKAESESLQDPIEYYKTVIGNLPLFRFISTHPDMDHMGGLFRLFYQERLPLYNFWHSIHNKELTEDDFKNSPYDYNDWLAYKHLSSGKHGAKVIQSKQGMSNRYYNLDDYNSKGDQIYIWAPNTKLEEMAEEQEEYNHVSCVLNIEYAGHRVILGSDAFGHEKHHAENSWTEICSWLGEDFNMKTLVLKASHHGHESGYHVDSVKRMNPSFTIISNSYGNENVRADLYRQWSDYVLSTFWCGNIIAEIDDSGIISIYTQKNRFNSQYIDPKTGYFLLPK